MQFLPLFPKHFVLKYPHCSNLGLFHPSSYTRLLEQWSRVGEEILGFCGTRSFFALFTESLFFWHLLCQLSPLLVTSGGHETRTLVLPLAGSDWSRATTATMSSMCCAVGSSGRHIYIPTSCHLTSTAWKCSKIQRRGRKKCCLSYASRTAQVTTTPLPLCSSFCIP
jgi:hypothetical protein